jgi:hypothetical protein
LGEAAGIASAIAKKDSLCVLDIDTEKLKDQIRLVGGTID